MSSALVFAGGGVAGIAWEIGVLAGLAESDPELFARLTAPDATYVGTSAGSVVATQLASGVDIETLYAAQVSAESKELSPDVDIPAVMQLFADAAANATSPEDGRRRIGAVAKQTDRAIAPARLASVAARLPSPDWSERRVLLTTVDADTGELRVLDRASGVGLRDAVAASCAVPGVWPTVEVDGRQYMDGGVSSIANVPLAAGSDPVLVIAPLPEQGAGFGAIAPDELASLGDARVTIVYADEAAVAAFGPNPLDPTTRPPSARAGRALGIASAPRIAAAFA
jgi:NTE family protein